MSVDLDLHAVDVPGYLSLLGIEPRVEGREARFSCPYPAHAFGDKNPSAYMNIDTTAFICFSCGATGNAITFLADFKGVSRAVAKNWIAQKWAPQYAQIDDLRGFISEMFTKVAREEAGAEFEPLPEEEYEKRWVDWHKLVAAPWARYMVVDRGFDPGILRRFEVAYDDRADRPCLTVRTRDGQLVGFKGRAWREGQWPKYMVLGDTERTLAERGPVYGFRPYDAGQHVFGVHVAEPDHGTLIVCEGELNVISMHEKGFANTVGPSGSTLSDKQVRDIVSMCERVVLLFDTDRATIQSYMTARAKLFKAIESFEPFVDVLVCEDHDGDPAEMEREDVCMLINKAMSSTLFRVLHLR